MKADGRRGILMAGVLAASLAACSGADLPQAQGRCTKRSDCKTGQICQSGACIAAPCGGTCDEEETCLNNRCEKLSGLSCTADPARCGSKYTCAPSGLCQRRCTGAQAEDVECPESLYPRCNLDASYCAECTFESDCAQKSGRTHCDTEGGRCVECNSSAQCAVNGAPAGRFCDPASLTCVQGCHRAEECAIGQICQGGSDATVGKCVDCLDDANCHDAPRLHCNPQTNLCVQCLGNDDCAGTATSRCDQDTHTCVVCTVNQDCPRNQICNLDSHTCAPGCRGGLGGPNCKENWVCDQAGGGSFGRCVECLQDVQCPRTKVCVTTDVAGVPTPACQTGCREGGTGPARDARCADPAHLATDTKCNGDATPYGKCVQCLTDSNCGDDTRLACDTQKFVCRCRKEGEYCTTNADCGFIRFNGDVPVCDTTPADRYFCVKSIRCVSSQSTCSAVTPLLARPVCTKPGPGLPGSTQGCPPDFATEEACDANGVAVTPTRQCVPQSVMCRR